MSPPANKDVILYGAPGPTLALLLDDPEEHDFVCAERALAGLSGEMACRGSPPIKRGVDKIDRRGG